MEEQMGSMTLSILKNKFIKEMSESGLVALLKCIKDSQLILMANVIMSEEDKAEFMDTSGNPENRTEFDVMLRPDLLEGDDGSHMIAVYSTMDEVPANVRTSLMPITIACDKVVELAHNTEGAEGIVLDPYTEPFVLPFELADIIEEIDGLDPEMEAN